MPQTPNNDFCFCAEGLLGAGTFVCQPVNLVNLPVERDYGGDTRNHDNPRAKRLAWECSSFQWVVVFDVVPAILGIRLPL